MFEVSKKLWCGFDDLKALFQQLTDQTMVCLQGGESFVVNIIHEWESRSKIGDCPSPKGWLLAIDWKRRPKRLTVEEVKVKWRSVQHTQVGGVTARKVLVGGIVDDTTLDCGSIGLRAVIRTAEGCLSRTERGKEVLEKDISDSPLQYAIPLRIPEITLKGGVGNFPSVFCRSGIVRRRLTPKELIGLLDIPISYERVLSKVPKKEWWNSLSKTIPIKVLLELGSCLQRKLNNEVLLMDDTSSKRKREMIDITTGDKRLKLVGGNGSGLEQGFGINLSDDLVMKAARNDDVEAPIDNWNRRLVTRCLS